MGDRLNRHIRAITWSALVWQNHVSDETVASLSQLTTESFENGHLGNGVRGWGSPFMGCRQTNARGHAGDSTLFPMLAPGTGRHG